MNRIKNLDYLRGLAAFGIMSYHYLSWTLGEFESNTLFGRIGVYGVSIFYILSGLTLFHVYKDYTLDASNLYIFFKKRIFRIFPLLWMVSILSIILNNTQANFIDIALNFTGLFGLFKWSTYFAVGAWSIGNELSFYLFFPLFLWAIKRNKTLMFFLIFLITSLYIYFTYSFLNPYVGLSENWHNYTNPLNQLFLFVSGILLGAYFSHIHQNNKLFLLVLSFGFLLFVFYPSSGNLVNIVTGNTRLVLTFSCLLICLSFYKINYNVPSIVHKSLKLLGDISYSVYFIHPIAYTLIGLINENLRTNGHSFNESFRLMFSIIFTLIASFLVYNYFEKFFIKIGKSTILPQGVNKQ